MKTSNKSFESGRPSEKQGDAPSNADHPLKVVADFGGRRKIFDRRLRQIPITHADRRSPSPDRRSGFDRRSAIRQQETPILQRRKDDAAPPADPHVDI